MPAAGKPQPNESQQLDLVRDRFTNTAKSFADFALTQRFAESERLAEMAAADAEAGSWRALDLACGPGTFARSLARRVRFTAGLDLTPAMLVHAKAAVERVSESAGFVCGDARRLPFADDAFDVATCGYAIHHVLYPERVVAELARVVRPGGRVAIVDIVVSKGTDREKNTGIEKARDASHTETQREDEFEEMLHSAGLRIRTKETAEIAAEFRSLDERGERGTGFRGVSKDAGTAGSDAGGRCGWAAPSNQLGGRARILGDVSLYRGGEMMNRKTVRMSRGAGAPLP